LKFVEPRPYADPEVACRKIMELAFAFTPTQKDGRIYIEAINAPMLYEHKADPAEYWAGLQAAIGKGWIKADPDTPLRILQVPDHTLAVELTVNDGLLSDYRQGRDFPAEHQCEQCAGLRWACESHRHPVRHVIRASGAIGARPTRSGASSGPLQKDAYGPVRCPLNSSSQNNLPILHSQPSR
jgi:hypothetical protein